MEQQRKICLTVQILSVFWVVKKYTWFTWLGISYLNNCVFPNYSARYAEYKVIHKPRPFWNWEKSFTKITTQIFQRIWSQSISPLDFLKYPKKPNLERESMVKILFFLSFRVLKTNSFLTKKIKVWSIFCYVFLSATSPNKKYWQVIH